MTFTAFETYVMLDQSLFEKDSLWLRRYRIRWLGFPSRFEMFFKIKAERRKGLDEAD